MAGELGHRHGARHDAHASSENECFQEKFVRVGWRVCCCTVLVKLFSSSAIVLFDLAAVATFLSHQTQPRRHRCERKMMQRTSAPHLISSPFSRGTPVRHAPPRRIQQLTATHAVAQDVRKHHAQPPHVHQILPTQDGPSTSVADKTATQVRAEVTRRIQSLGRANKPREAVLQLAEMAKLGVQPDTQAATALIDACARNGNMDMAQSVFDELFDGFLQPDDITFSVLVRGYGEVCCMHPSSRKRQYCHV